MAHRDVVLAVEQRLAAGFLHADDCPIRVENSGNETPEGGGPWLLVDFPYSNSGQATIGDPGANRYHEEGAFRVVIAVPIGTGAHEARDWLDEIAALFRGQRFDGVRTYAPTSAASDDRNDAANYFRLSIAVPYDFSLIG